VRLTSVTKRFGDLAALDAISLDVRRGEFMTLLGPSGSGKTTTLRIVAGFTQPDAGTVTLDGRDITRLPAHRRNIGMVFQNYALFPHMTAADNIAFPLRVRRMSGHERRTKVADALALVHLSGLGGRYPRQLSGGQQQRVALARAIVFGPPLLLMDEPLGALDKKLRDAMQLEITRISRELDMTVIYVTHDQEEALALSDRIAIYNAGQVEQVGTGAELYETPVSLFAATFMGESTVLRGLVQANGDQVVLLCDDQAISVSLAGCRRVGVGLGQRAAVIVRPERIEVASNGEGETGHGRAVRGIVTEQIYLGSIRKYVVDIGHSRKAIVRVPLGAESRWPEVGQPVVLTWALEHGVVVADRDVPTHPEPGRTLSGVDVDNDDGFPTDPDTSGRTRVASHS
jgi:putative spermidine/putrescine transport system ATP-binding protein